MIQTIDDVIREKLTGLFRDLETIFEADILTYFGTISESDTYIVDRLLSSLNSEKEGGEKKLAIMLTTPGGSALAVEQLVNIVRHFYNEVIFVVPDYAYSAGTIFCMSGDSIYMNYRSRLGPIDPQVQTRDGRWVAALGYLDKIEELLKKSAEGNLTDIEAHILLNFDLAELRTYEQARDLSIALIQDWLVKYKFKDWVLHRTNPKKKGKKVELSEKKESKRDRERTKSA